MKKASFEETSAPEVTVSAPPERCVPTPIQVTFDQGTLLIQAGSADMAPLVHLVQWDPRANAFRTQARHYGPILLNLHQRKIPFQDQARQFSTRDFRARGEPPMRPHQQEALNAWNKQGCKGVVVLPTGAGKSLLARRAMCLVQRDTLILVPTLDLMHQWYEQLSRVFAQPIGLLGGGDRLVEPITVSTYDSAVIHMERIGNRFGFLVCDECHHLPTPSTRLAATLCIAPFRLGLSATPERADGGEQQLFDLLGPLCHRTEIPELEGSFLAPYRWEQVAIELDADEREAYESSYAHYRQFIKEQGISLKDPGGWSRFIQISARSREGRAAMEAWRVQKRIARASRSKLRSLWELLRRHRQERILIFTDDNATAYTIGETFFLPVITHRTKVSERKRFMDAFRSGAWSVMVSSRVLNEGVDVPEVAVGIIVSGTGSVREHVQRLGRILRPAKGKQAILYELVSSDTAETFTSARRRQHLAYQRQEEAC
ncbi:MAG: DEAD/DEAH box helicase family protein [Magnetococcales bacterium]|nr:DEAD/DEAH box helicase family protein [Magnetococcales bacterium]